MIPSARRVVEEAQIAASVRLQHNLLAGQNIRVSISAESHSPVSAGDMRFHLHPCNLTDLERILFHFRSPDHAIDDGDVLGVMLFVMQS